MAEKEDEKYEVLEKIGQGSFGIIRKVRSKATGQILCRKEISYSRMSDREKAQLHAELKILESLRHPNIVQYCHREHLKSSHDLHLYMEYCGNGDLGGYVKKLRERGQYADEDFVWTIFAQLAGALYRCHYGEDPPRVGEESKVAKGRQPFQTKEGYRVILHRDLKPENVFLGENNRVKLGDFGLSKIIASHDFASTYVGTPFYMSPEICAAERYSHHSDIWSLGCIIYELATRSVPFDARNHVELIMKIKAGRIKPLPVQYSKELSDAISWCLKVDPRARPDTAQLLNVSNIKLARTRLQQIEERNTAQPLQQERDAALAKLAQAQAQILELNKEVQKLKDASKKVEMEWHARATLAIDQKVHEQVETHKAELLKQFNTAVDQRADEKLSLHLASLPSSHGLTEGTSTHVRSCTPPPGKIASFTTTATTEFATDRSSTVESMEGFALDTDLTSLSIQEEVDDASPLAQRTKLIKKPRKSFGRAKTFANCNINAGAVASPMDVLMADQSPMPPQIAPMSIKGLSLSPRKNGRDRLSGGLGMRRDIFHRGQEQQLRPTVPSEHLQPEVGNSFDDDDLFDDDIEGILGDSPSRPTSGLSSHSNPANGVDPFKTLENMPLSRPNLARQKTMPPNTTQTRPRGNIFSTTAASRAKSPTLAAAREKENRPPSAHIVLKGGSPERARKQLTPSRKAPPPPVQTESGRNKSKSLSRMTPGKTQGRTLLQLQQERSQAPPTPMDVEVHDIVNVMPTKSETTFGLPPVPRLLPSPAKWDALRDGDEMPSPFLAKRVIGPMVR